MFKLSRKRHRYQLLFLFCFIFAGCALLPSTVFAATGTLDEFKALGERFDHLTTGYALTGEHEIVECGDCHIGGVFEALPRECDACHDNVIAVGTPSIHIETNQPCDVCHTTMGFLASAVMDHSTIDVPCGSCHSGFTATGKSPDHMLTTNICEGCHSTNFWAPVTDVDHDQVQGSCVSCHTPNGVAQTNKGPNHMPTDDLCDDCHLAIGIAWVPVPPGDVNHNNVVGACSSCHDGIIATGKGPDHVVTAQECNACHVPGGAGPPDEWAATQ